ncbi:hypothetical protein [Arthrobacter sp. 754]|uniref:hypothetical protein n=1 Tax=Arthrobacter sp. 754 TaxID=3156315 RepID=UPI0033946380
MTLMRWAAGEAEGPVDPFQPVFAGMDVWSGRIWSALGFIAAAIAAVAALAAVACLFWRPVSWLGRRTRAHALFGSKGRYVVKDVSDPPGCPGTGAVVRARILDEVFEARQGARTMTVLDGPGATLPSPVVELPANYRWLTPLVNSLFTRPYETTVNALPADGGKVSIKVVLGTSKGKVMETRRISETVRGGAVTEAYSEAASRAGAWLAFTLAKHAQPRRLVRRSDQRVVIFGTESWESYALLRKGQRRTELTEQMDAYKAALFEDPCNVGALARLGHLQGNEPANLDTLSQGINHLSRADHLLNGKADGMTTFRFALPGTRADPRWYQITYQRTVAFINRYYARAAKDGFAESDLAQALSLGVELARAVGATQLTLASKWRRWSIMRDRQHDLQDLLDRDGLDLASLLAGPLAVIEKRNSWKDAPSTLAQIVPHRFGTTYEFWKLLAGLHPPGVESTLEWSGPSSRNLLAAQLEFATLSTPEGNRAEDSLGSFLPWRVRYQRACVLVEMELYEDAVDELSLILDYASSFSASSLLVVDWVKKDPALRPLFRQSRRLARLTSIHRSDGRPGKGQRRHLRQQQVRLALMLNRSEERLAALPRELILQGEIVNDPRG